ncbi:MAG: response regulator [Chloroflexi bacterium]|nr:response regulator [Chloroflexota bacterium]
MDYLHAEAGRWATLLSLLLAPCAVALFFSAPSAFVLLAVPVALAGLLIAAWALPIAALMASALLWLAWRRGPLPFGDLDLWIALAGIWCGAGVGLVVYYIVKRVVSFSWEQYRQAQAIIAETRDRQEELHEALASQAYLNRQLLLTTQKLEEARAVAEEAQKLKADFVARVSHELRTPLNMIIGFGQMITESPEVYGNRIPPTLMADLSVIVRNSEHLSELIDDVLDLSRLDAGRMSITCERVNLRELIEAATVAVRPLFEAKGLSLTTDIADDLPLVYCDETRIREVVVNLLSNAGRYTDVGGVSIRVWRQGIHALVAVQDTGPGIDPVAGKRLFEPFEQLESAARRRHGGTGLGLTISKRFVELHGGKMWFESQVGRGTTFYFRLPIDPPPAISGGPLRWLEPLWEYKERAPRPELPEADVRLRLMVIEAGEALRRLLGRYLNNVEIVAAKTVAEAVEMLRREPVQALLVNVSSVSEGLRQITAEARAEIDVPIITCCIPDVHDVANRLGIMHYLLKPVSREQLLGTLDRLPLRGKTVLIVDDEPEALRLFWRMLSSSGRDYQVFTASDGEQALAFMKERRPDVMLLDLVMPNMDGFQLLEARSADPTLANIPVIVLSALDPSGQPIVSNSLAITKWDGLTVQQFLSCVEGLSRLFGRSQAGHRSRLETSDE